MRPPVYLNVLMFLRITLHQSAFCTRQVLLKKIVPKEWILTTRAQTRFFDVGGQRSERRKWIHCFNDVTSIIYVASLSEYDQFLVENSQVNRMEESLALFNAIIHCLWLDNASIILFLNKMDILAEKILFSDLKTYFPEFEGKRQDVHDAMLFIRNLYTQKAVSNETNNSKDIYCHFICAMDTTNTRKLFNIVKDFVLTGGLQEYKLL